MGIPSFGHPFIRTLTLECEATDQTADQKEGNTVARPLPQMA